MYRPSAEKYHSLVNEYLSDPAVRCFGAFREDRLSGIMIIRSGEILGIAVCSEYRRQSVGHSLVQHALSLHPILTAETDCDSVDFYRRCGFECTAFERVFPDGSCIRYHCERKA